MINKCDYRNVYGNYSTQNRVLRKPIYHVRTIALVRDRTIILVSVITEIVSDYRNTQYLQKKKPVLHNI